jgi:carbamate kinase
VLIVAALGGNALLERGERPDAEVQERHVGQAVAALAPLARAHQMLITHGNGPQVGMLALESEQDPALSHPYPLDALGAQTQGMIGYWLARSLRAEVSGKQVGCLICQTLVRADDPAFARPTKFVGQGYDELALRSLAADRGWAIGRDGEKWRRVVPSPEPVEVLELPLIKALLEAGAVIVCAGGGGIPVVEQDGRALRGVDAVVDKDLTSALLAQAVGADVLLLLTDVPAVIDGFGTASARPLDRATVAELRGGLLPAGSMGPKVEAACRFVAATGRRAVIGRLADAEAMFCGKAGTTVLPNELTTLVAQLAFSEYPCPRGGFKVCPWLAN